LQVKANGLVVFVPRYGIEGPVFLTDKDGNSLAPGAADEQQQQPQFVLDEDKQTVVAADGSARYSVFDKCAVRISVVEGAARRRSIKLALVPRSELAPEDVVG
jgi:exosome complex exonuclease DIS3/RRP44